MSFASGVGCGFNRPNLEKPLRIANLVEREECRLSASVSSGMDIFQAILSHPSTRMGQRFCQGLEPVATRIVSSQAMWHNRNITKGN